MKSSISHYIVSVPEKLINTIETETLTLYKNPAMADSFDHQRTGVVVCDWVFDTYGIKKGDTVYFHHNIVSEHIEYNGARKLSEWCIDSDKNWYKIPKTEIYAYERDGVFTPVGEFCFLEAEYTYKINPDKYPNLFLPDTNKVEAPNYGKLVYLNRELEDAGLKKGDSVYFDKYSKYPFPVHGKELWRMKNKWLIMKRDDVQAENSKG